MLSVGRGGEPEDTQQSTFAHTHTSSSHSTTSPWSPNPYPHCSSTLTDRSTGRTSTPFCQRRCAPAGACRIVLRVLQWLLKDTSCATPHRSLVKVQNSLVPLPPSPPPPPNRPSQLTGPGIVESKPCGDGSSCPLFVEVAPMGGMSTSRPDGNVATYVAMTLR